MKFVPFLAESKDDGFVIFRLVIDGEPDAFVWVRDGEKGSANGIRVTGFYAVVSCFTHTTEPMIVCSKADPEFVDDMFERIESCPPDDMEKMLGEFNREMEWRKKNKKEWDEYCAWEEEALKAVEDAEDSESGEVIF